MWGKSVLAGILGASKNRDPEKTWTSTTEEEERLNPAVKMHERSPPLGQRLLKVAKEVATVLLLPAPHSHIYPNLLFSILVIRERRVHSHYSGTFPILDD